MVRNHENTMSHIRYFQERGGRSEEEHTMAKIFAMPLPPVSSPYYFFVSYSTKFFTIFKLPPLPKLQVLLSLTFHPPIAQPIERAPKRKLKLPMLNIERAISEGWKQKGERAFLFTFSFYFFFFSLPKIRTQAILTKLSGNSCCMHLIVDFGTWIFKF